MSYTNNSKKSSRARRRARLRRKKRIRFLIILVLCLVLIIFLGALIYLIFAHKTKVKDYANTVYTDSVYKGEMYASNLCVASEDVELENAPSADNLTSSGLFCVDDATTLYANNIHEKLYPASLTKLMTALVALENGNLDDVVTVSADADSDKFATDEKTCGIHEGDQITLRDLLYGLLLYSGNDNAVAIADYIGGSTDKFADMMNEEAAKIMANNSHFVNANGLHDDDHYTTAYDLYLIFNECLKSDDFRTIISTVSYTPEITASDGSKRSGITWEPSNLYATGEATKPDNVTLKGGKTGTTLKAGNCLIMLSKGSDDKEYISIVMGASTKETLYDKMTQLIQAIPGTEHEESSDETTDETTEDLTDDETSEESTDETVEDSTDEYSDDDDEMDGATDEEDETSEDSDEYYTTE